MTAGVLAGGMTGCAAVWLAWCGLAACRRRALHRRLGALCGGSPSVSGRRGPPALRRRVLPGRPGSEDDRLPLAAELLAACLTAGAGPGRAAEAVGGCLPGPVGEGLRRAAAELRLGGDPAAVWDRFGRLPGAGGLARRLELAEASGAPVAGVVAAEAAECRARRLRVAQARARRAAVYATAPLGLCFLPAFLLIGVAPVLLGLARDLL